MTVKFFTLHFFAVNNTIKRMRSLSPLLKNIKNSWEPSMPPKKWPISVCILNWKTPSGQRFSDDDIRKERQKSNWKTQMDDSRKRFLRPFFVFFFLLLFFNFLGVLVPPPLSPPSCLSKQMGHQGGECTHVHVHFFFPLPVSLFARFFFLLY